MVGLARQACGEARVQGGNAAGVGGDEPFRRGQVGGQGVGREVRRGGQVVDLRLQRRNCCRVILATPVALAVMEAVLVAVSVRGV